MIDVQVRWAQLTARVEGMNRAAKVFLLAQRVHSEDSLGVAFKVFGEQAKLVLADVKDFRERYGQTLPSAARCALDRFLAPDGLSRYIGAGGISGLDTVKSLVPILVAMATEVAFTLSDNEALGARLIERALGHLQRTIAVVELEKQNWQVAFGRGEVACEKLGGLHLLRFGIFGFKADTTGARTDLIFGDCLNTVTPLLEASDALVATEWKLVRADSEVDAIALKGRNQLGLYTAGPLLGIEIRRTRYVILVSEGQLHVPEDSVVGEVTYRHVNIAVNPRTPSKAA